MNKHTTRREFLRNTAAAGGCLVIPGASSGRSAETQPRAAAATCPNPSAGRPATANAPILVVAPTVSVDVNARARTWPYIAEILHRAGLFFEQLSPDALPSLLGRTDRRIVLLAGHLPLSSVQRQALAAWVKQGGCLLGIGGTSGLAEVFGAGAQTPLGEGWIKITAQDHPVTGGLRSSLHVFGGHLVKPSAGTSLACVEAANRAPQGSAILENRFGQGTALLLAPDLIFSIVHIQQGLPVLQDAKAAPDATAAVDEGCLKAEDGLVLDWTRDRQLVLPAELPAFLEPVSDELRQIIVRSILHLAQRQGIAMPVLWYWPQRLKGVGHISHDSDGNDPKKAVALLDVMRRCDVRSTWCVMYPGGYPADFYCTLEEQGYEIALHYDARTGGEETSWSKENFLLQHRWLTKEAGLRHIASNKNHYTRWEGRLEFFRWCQEVGIDADQTRGPSKKGTVGFPLGGSQPYFPIDDETDSPRLLNVLEVNLLTQDLTIFCPAEHGRPLLDSALRHHGVAHFLFHPAHILKPKVADTLTGLVEYGKAQGLQWWTSRQIVQWERLRRGVRATFGTAGAVTLHAAAPIQQATLLVLRPERKPRSVSINGRAAPTEPWTVYGFEFDVVTTDIAGELRLQTA